MDYVREFASVLCQKGCIYFYFVLEVVNVDYAKRVLTV